VDVLITGGTGTLGVSLVAAAEAAGHTVRVMSRRPRSETEKKVSETAEWIRADLATGEGVADAVAGVDAIPLSYYRHKREAERIVERGDGPHTVLRATQFHTFVASILSAAMRIPWVTGLPTDFQMQSVAASEVADRLVGALDDGPGGRVPNVGGPEVRRVGEMARAWLRVKGRRKRLFRLPLPGRTARAFRAGKNTDPDRKEGTIRWAEWLRRSAQ
jgi:uncharacterized protein YbjT (DUF2867 family)